MLKLLGLIALASVASAVVTKQYPYHSTQDKPPEHENEPGCWISDLNKVLPFDKPYYPENKCQKYICEEETWNAYSYSCDKVRQEDLNCHQTKEEDLTKQFPSCCTKIECDDADN